jgi:hypothetical protein
LAPQWRQGWEDVTTPEEWDMKRLAIRAGALALALIGLPAGLAVGADLDYGRRYEREPYAPYYSEREPVPPPARYWDQRGDVAPPCAGPYSYKDGPPPPGCGAGYAERYVGPRDYVNRDGRGCLSKGEIHLRLKEHGWRDFHDIDLRPDGAEVSARRPDGLLYRLHVDRCTGVILNARLVDDGRTWRQGARNFSY